MEQMNIQVYVNQAQSIGKDLLVNEIYDTIVSKLLLSYMNYGRYLIITLYINCK